MFIHRAPGPTTYVTHKDGSLAVLLARSEHSVAVEMNGELALWPIVEVAMWERPAVTVLAADWTDHAPPPTSVDERRVDLVLSVFRRMLRDTPEGAGEAEAAATLTLAYFQDRANDYLSGIAS